MRQLLYASATTWAELMAQIESLVQMSGGSPISVSHTALTFGNNAAFSAILIVEA